MKENIMDTNTKIVIACVDSACAMFETGHAGFWSQSEEVDVIHERPVLAGMGYTVKIVWYYSQPLWSVEVETDNADPTFTPDQAVSFAADLLKASTECRTLNA
jgi:hypothetical protein